mmetsp:Transcript_97178/g.247129  ORF Transcript_97178/g.247129 Transcript_97178/m.247129 type:complete len:293 (-) Transcript_97178:26-904(-)|eukprot:CAMPEP_0183554748 /NCGR_PEP_ID=MMETSP0371-20130417/79040_1 /TAXON_ID=268820 /ORGANISM="Peridinium aciculiferum, Strain PAER-2" /LENGTH=292 /DNA_ID=CAMNT_0025760743 /DNA_START=156 /DNA_END=1034 /DNA_ORIENTATION=-
MTSDQAAVEDPSVVELSPFDVHFSQDRIRSEFQDGRELSDTVGQIEAVARPFGTAVAASAAAEEEQEGSTEPLAEDVVLLHAPFPRIEVIKWRCKLREADGAPRLDPVSGLQLYSEDEQWFTFDNRRLCCLQRAAASIWPKRALCEVVEIPQSLARTRELRKFDTRTGGHSVTIGKRDDTTLETWCWRTAVGLPTESQAEGGVARQQRLRWRGQRREGPNSRGTNKGRREQPEEAVEGGGMEFARSMSLFLLVYLVLRFAMWAVRKEHWSYWPGRLLEALSAVGGASSNATV